MGLSRSHQPIGRNNQAAKAQAELVGKVGFLPQYRNKNAREQNRLPRKQLRVGPKQRVRGKSGFAAQLTRDANDISCAKMS